MCGEAERLQHDREFVQRLTGEGSSTEQTLLPLDQPRVIAIRDGKHAYTFHFRRISQADWQRYFERIVFKARNEGTKQITTIDVEYAALDLFQRTLERVEGFTGDFATRSGWQERIAPRYAYRPAMTLVDVGPSKEGDDEACNPEQIAVSLDAVWSRSTVGQMAKYQGLVHRFAPPSVEQKRRYYNAGSQSTVIGGTRNGTTIYGKRHQVLLDVYDELILDVEGYGIGGHELHAPEEIRREMDAYHKFIAAQQIFIPLQPALEAEENIAA